MYLPRGMKYSERCEPGKASEHACSYLCPVRTNDQAEIVVTADQGQEKSAQGGTKRDDEVQNRAQHGWSLR
jgi:hypothetical protein